MRSSIPASAATDEPKRSLYDWVGHLAKSLPEWLRRFGVHGVDVEDATQDTFAEAWQDPGNMVTDAEGARAELLLISARVAQRYRRRARRDEHANIEDVELPDSRDVEAYVGRWRLFLDALKKLDEPAQALIVMHHLEERTYEEIGAELGEKEDTIRKRVNVATEKLRAEIERKQGQPRKRKGSSSALMVGLGFDAFDRAVLRSVLEVEEKMQPPPPPSGVHRLGASKSALLIGVPAAVLIGVLVLLLGETSSAEPRRAAKIADVLPDVPVVVLPKIATTPDTPENVSGVVSASPRALQPQHPEPIPKLDKETITSFRRVRTQGAR